ncbi:Crp/Fnr family transcriptional regulator [Sphingobacterium wenxiniae]|nr:Crp/Fnr family transcriptional regulator [Sphingobacterium wenxiniae]
MQLIVYLRTNFGLSNEVLQQIDEASTTKVYPKKEIILQPGHYSKNVYFVQEGLVRMFYPKGGKHITHYFFPEMTFAGATDSMFYDKQSIYGIEAVETSTVTRIPLSVIMKLAEDTIAVNQLIQTILVEALMGFSSRLQSLQFETAQERYQNLLTQHPGILLRAPLGDIASYLGISQQTLSVIRAQR